MRKYSKKADLDKGINIDGERLQNLRFADDENNKGNGGTPEQTEHRKQKMRTENTQRQNEVYDKL